MTTSNEKAFVDGSRWMDDGKMEKGWMAKESMMMCLGVG
jgi:hypothetical protein